MKDDARRGRRHGWEGIIAKAIDSRYEPGNRSRNWLKLKIEFRQEFVVGGYTEPRNSREHIGALLLGYFDKDRFIYVGHTGGGFTRKGLEEMYHRLKPLERKTSPFEETPKTNEKAHCKARDRGRGEIQRVDARDGAPADLPGCRDDKDPEEVGLEQRSVQKASARGGRIEKRKARPSIPARAKAATKTTRPRTTRRSATQATRQKEDTASLLAQLTAIEAKGGEGSLDLGGGNALKVSSLDKVFSRRRSTPRATSAVLHERAASSSSDEDRPLVLKRFPKGRGESFFNRKASETHHGIRVATSIPRGEEKPRYVGGPPDSALQFSRWQFPSIPGIPLESLEYSDSRS